MEIGQKEAAESKNRIVRKWEMYVGECRVGVCMCVCVCMCRMGQSSKMDQKTEPKAQKIKMAEA